MITLQILKVRIISVLIYVYMIYLVWQRQRLGGGKWVCKWLLPLIDLWSFIREFRRIVIIIFVYVIFTRTIYNMEALQPNIMGRWIGLLILGNLVEFRSGEISVYFKILHIHNNNIVKHYWFGEIPLLLKRK